MADTLNMPIFNLYGIASDDVPLLDLSKDIARITHLIRNLPRGKAKGAEKLKNASSMLHHRCVSLYIRLACLQGGDKKAAAL